MILIDLFIYQIDKHIELKKTFKVSILFLRFFFLFQICYYSLTYRTGIKVTARFELKQTIPIIHIALL
jgi:hypothetical protein